MIAQNISNSVIQITANQKSIGYTKVYKQGKGLQHMTYRELQARLKELRVRGYDVQVKLNASKEILQAEYDRLTGEVKVTGYDYVDMTVEEIVESGAVITEKDSGKHVEEYREMYGVFTEVVEENTEENEEEEVEEAIKLVKERGFATREHLEFLRNFYGVKALEYLRRNGVYTYRLIRRW